MRQALAAGVRRQLRLGAVERTDGATATAVHVAGAVLERSGFVERGYVQRCSRCGRVLATLTDLEMWRDRARTEADLRRLAEARFFAEGRHIAEGPTANYLVSDRPLAADEKECESVPVCAWE
jgi:hypothetical protein